MEVTANDIAQTKKILIVDDDEGLNSLLQRVLKRAGYVSEGVSAGSKALEILATNTFDLLLLDYQLPDMSAANLIELLKAAKINIPFVVMTGHGDEKIAVAMMKAGARDYLIKDGNYIDMLPHSIIRQFKEIEMELNFRKAEQQLIQSQIQLQTEHEQLLSIYESITEPICVIDLESFDILYSNQTFQEHFGNYNSTKCYGLIRHSNQVCEECPMTILSTGPTQSVYWEHQNPINKHWYKCVDKLIRWTNGKDAHFQLAVDITTNKKNEEELLKSKLKAEESDHLKSAFLANLSHEIRTPMNAIMGFADLLIKENFSTEKQQELLGVVKERSEYLLHIINDILDISRIEVGQMEIVPQKGNLGDLFDDLYNYYLTKEFVTENYKQIELRKALLIPEEKRKIRADFDRIKQVLGNLIDNAFKFTNNGLIEFECSLINSELIFYVKDTGIGIPLSKQSVIFDRFRQVDELYLSQRAGGIGLGLTISKGLVELMNGRIWLESKEGQGTIFYFSIPYVPESENKQVESGNLNESYNWANKTFLIVEDEPSNIELLTEYLSHTNAKCLKATNTKDAFDIFQQNPNIELILMDIRLPDGNGIDLCQKMKAIHPNVIVLAQTAYAYSNERDVSLAHGCNAYITKPIKKDELLRTIETFFQTPSNKPSPFSLSL